MSDDLDGANHDSTAQSAQRDAGDAIVYFEDRKGAQQSLRKLWAKRSIYIAIFSVLVIAITAGIVALIWNPSDDATHDDGSLATTEAPPPTLAPTSANLGDVLEALEAYSDATALADHESPQFKAARWLATDPVYLGQPETMLQRYSLAVFFFALGGETWKACSLVHPCNALQTGQAWLSDTDECSWEGLACDDEGFLEKIELVDPLKLPKDVYFRGTVSRNGVDMYLSGAAPPEIEWWTKLREMTLLGFSLSGSLDRWLPASLTNLETVVLIKNSISGSFPETFWTDHPSIRSFDVSWNSMTGSIPSGTAAASSLTVLGLVRNQFNGTIPTTFASGLKALRLRGNELTGGIPSELSTLTALQNLDLRHTQLTGGIPSELYQMERLISLQLDNTPIGGTLFEDVGDLCDTLENLELFNVSLTGSLPAALGNCTRLRTLYMADNLALNGTVPDSLCDLVIRKKADVISDDVLKLRITMPCGVTCNCCFSECHIKGFD